jgi:hypothetical protein
MDRRTFLLLIPSGAFLSSMLTPKKVMAYFPESDTNESICKAKFEFAASHKLQKRPINEVMSEIGRSFIGIDYAANTIEAPGKEQLIVNLQTLDCVTFYENTLVLARCIKKGAMTFDDYRKELQFVRYRGGIIDGYPSRLHYTTDYFFDNEKKGVLKDITRQIGGISYKKKINFMTAHPESYPRLQENPEFIQAIRAIEQKISRRTLCHIPKEKVKNAASKIKDGDIIGITAKIEGLDCSHTGIAVRQGGKLHLMHAPIPGTKVQITELPLWEYLAKIKKDAGIIVARPSEPK